MWTLFLWNLPYGQTQSGWDVVIPFEPLWQHYKRIAKPRTAFLFTAQRQFMVDLILSNRMWYRYEWVWNKGKAANFASANSRPLISHEFVLVFYANAPTYNPQKTVGKAYTHNRPGDVAEGTGVKRSTKTVSDGMRYPYSIIRVQGHSQRGLEHPTQKPVNLMEYLIKTYSNPGDVVLDNCMGSGTTGVAAILTDRKFIGIEKDEQYFKIAKRRMTDIPQKLW